MYKIDLGVITHAIGNSTALTVDGGSAFMRVGVRPGEGEIARWLVAELDGVRVYIQRPEGSREVEILVTKDDVYP